MSVAAVAEVIKAAAAEQGLKLYVVSLKADLDPTTLPKALQRGTRLRPDALRRIAKVLGRPFLEFLFVQEDVTRDELESYVQSRGEPSSGG